jgi:hypothetical protein
MAAEVVNPYEDWTAPRAWVFLPCDYRLPAQLYYAHEVRGFSLERGLKIADGEAADPDGTWNETPGFLIAVR